MNAQLSAAFSRLRPWVGFAARQVQIAVRELRLRDPLVYCTCAGHLPNQGGSLVLHYLGRKRFIHDFISFFAHNGQSPDVVQEILSDKTFTKFLWERRAINAPPPGADIMVVDNFLNWSYPAENILFAPYINGVLKVAADLDQQLAAVRSKGHRRKLQSALKTDFKWRKTHSLADFNFFYDVMYAPFVQNRFGYGASLVSRPVLQREFNRRGFLLFAETDGEPTSGALMYTTQRKPHVLNYWKYGLAYGETLDASTFSERNAMTEVMVLRYAVNEGFQEIDFGLTRAVSSDGIFTHKKRVGCDFHWLNTSPQFAIFHSLDKVAPFLHQYPLLVRRQGQPVAQLAFSGPITPRNLSVLSDQLHNSCFPALGSIDLYVTAALFQDNAAQQSLLAITAAVTQEEKIPIYIKSCHQATTTMEIV